MCCLTSTKFLNLNVVFTKKASKLGGKPVVHSYAVILMLLGLFPEKFRDFFNINNNWYIFLIRYSNLLVNSNICLTNYIYHRPYLLKVLHLHICITHCRIF